MGTRVQEIKRSKEWSGAATSMANAMINNFLLFLLFLKDPHREVG